MTFTGSASSSTSSFSSLLGSCSPGGGATPSPLKARNLPNFCVTLSEVTSDVLAAAFAKLHLYCTQTLAEPTKDFRNDYKWLHMATHDYNRLQMTTSGFIGKGSALGGPILQ